MKLLLLILLSLLTFCLLTCQSDPNLRVSSRPSEPVPGGTITIGLVGNLSSLNPLADLNKTLAILSPLLYESVNQINPYTGRIRAHTLSLPVVSDNGLTLTYTLADQGLRLSDVKASLEAAIWPGVAGSTQTITVSGYETIAITLSQAHCGFAERLAQLPILAQETMTGTVPLASGPFQVQAWQQETNTLNLVPNPASVSGPSWLESITVQLYKDQASAWAALQAGELDLLPWRDTVEGIPDDYYRLVYPSSQRIIITFNHKDEVMQLPQVRQALRLAINRPRFLSQVFDNQGLLTASPLHPFHWATERSLSLPPYDPRQAASLLDEAGAVDRDGDGWRDLPDGQPWQLGLRVYGDDLKQTNVAFFIAAAYRALNIHARAELVPQFTILDDLLTYDYQAGVYAFPSLPDLDQRVYWHSDQIEAELGLNVAAYTNADVDKWLDQANQTAACDGASRVDLYGRIQQQVVADAAVDFLVVPLTSLIVRDELHGLRPGPFAPFTWNAEDWYFGRD